jgi:chromosome segregation ATPase
MRKRLEQAEDEIEYLKERAGRTEKRIGRVIREIADELIDDDKRLTKLSEKLEKHQKIDSDYWNDFMVRICILEKRKDELISGFRAHHKLYQLLSDGLAKVELDMSQFFEAYYRVFPERSEQDAKLINQLKNVYRPGKPRSKGKPA